jgi:hypothetical protein
LRPNGDKKFNKKKPYNKKFERKPNEPMTLEDIERWIKKNSNHEKPRRSRANSLGEYKKNKRRK